MELIKDGYKLSSGREFSANCGIIGLSPKEEYGWEVHEGYDGGIYDEEWTPDEKRELADFMIDLWQKFKADA